MLESLLNDEAHRLNRCPSLLTKLYHAICRIAVGKKIINEQDMVFLRKETIADAYRIIPVLGKGMYYGGKHIVHRLRLLLLDEHHRKLQDIAHKDCRSNAACLYSDDFVYIQITEEPDELRSEERR